MVINKRGEGTRININIDGDEIQQVKAFKYLGQIVTEDGKCEEEIKKRIIIAKLAFSKMNKILTRPQIPLPTRIRILHCYIWSTLLYGSETWTISTTMKDRIKAFAMWMYRRMLRIPWTDKVTNLEIINRINTRHHLFKTIQIKKLRYFGHIARHNNLQRVLLDGKIEARRGRGRPRIKWGNNIKQWTGLNHIEAIRRAQDRNDWRYLTSNPREDGTK